jgi:hypothetical protein
MEFFAEKLHTNIIFRISIYGFIFIFSAISVKISQPIPFLLANGGHLK